MEDYKGSKIEVVPSSSNSLGDSSMITYQLKGSDDQFYNVQIFLKDNSFIITTKIVGDFTELMYSKKYTLEELYNLNTFFRQYLSIEELFKLFLKNLKQKEIIIYKKDGQIIFSFFVVSRNKKEKIIFVLNKEKLDLEKVLYKLCEKIKEIDKLNKLKQEKKNLQKNNRTIIMKLIESKFSLLLFFLFFLLVNIATIIYIRKMELELKYIKSQNSEMKIFEKSLNLLIKEVNKKFNNIIEQKSNDINNEFSQVKKEIKTNNNIIINKIKEIENNKKISISNNKISYNNKLKLIDNYIFKNIALNLINEGIINKKKETIKNYELIFKASRDGYKSIDFHKKCDWITNTVTFIVSSTGRIFGGFTDVSWDSESDAKEGSNGFIFSLDNMEIYYNINVKFNIRCLAEYGPIFGNFDLFISDNCNRNKSFINSYAYDTFGKENILNGSNFFYVEDYEVYKLELERLL